MRIVIYFALLIAVVLGQSPSQCGRRKTSRIMGGQDALVNEFPMMAGLAFPYQTVFCAATILNNRFAISASHCLKKPEDYKWISLVVADHDQRVPNESPYTAIYGIERVLLHPGYVEASGANDIALLKTWKTIKFNVAVGPVCLPNNNDQYIGKIVEIAGWGLRDATGEVSPILQKTRMIVMANDKCAYFYGQYVTKGHICLFTQTRDICRHDSGGPIYYQGIDGLLYLVGIITMSGGCNALKPSGGIRVSEYLPWIKANSVV